MTLKERLGKEWLFCDGGTGTILQELGLKGGELPELWNLTRPDDIRALNRGYFEAGSNIVNANMFGANRFKFDNVTEIVTAAVKLCQEARHEAGRDDDAYVAIDIGPTGKLLAPMGDLPFNEAVEVFSEEIRAGARAGADVIVIETMSDAYEAKAAVIAAHEVCDLPVIVTCVYDDSGKLLTGGGIEGTVAMLEGLKVDALGVNCGFGPDKMLPLVKRIADCCSLPIVVNPNAGLPRTEGSRTVYDVMPDEFCEVMKEIAKLGVHVMGGCCGTTPEYISKLVETIKPLPFTEPVRKHRTYVTSSSACVEIGPKPVIIGEFHFGSLDRGALNAGLQPCRDMKERMEKYKRYVRYAIKDERIVGTHWFHWHDMPLTGWLDGENYCTGVMDVTDNPHPEMIEATRELARELYRQ